MVPLSPTPSIGKTLDKNSTSILHTQVMITCLSRTTRSLLFPGQLSTPIMVSCWEVSRIGIQGQDCRFNVPLLAAVYTFSITASSSLTNSWLFNFFMVKSYVGYVQQPPNYCVL